MTIFNLEDISKERFVVGVFDNDDFYAYGAYSTIERAEMVATEIGGQIIDRHDIA